MSILSSVSAVALHSLVTSSKNFQIPTKTARHFFRVTYLQGVKKMPKSRRFLFFGGGWQQCSQLWLFEGEEDMQRVLPTQL